MTALLDTNILVYRFDHRFPEKQARVTDLMRQRILDDSLRIPHQAIFEFLAVTTCPLGDGLPLLPWPEAIREAEDQMRQFRVLYPNPGLSRLAFRGASTYQLPWFDAHLWACAEFFGLQEILTEDFQDGRFYGTVRIRNPFLA